MQELPFKRAFVLHTRDFKENQLIADLLVQGEGRLAAVGYKGSKKNSARTALFSPFRAVQIQIKPGNGLHKIKNIESVEQDIKLTGNRLFCGFYLNELVCRLCPADEHFDLLHPIYSHTLSQLASLSAVTDSNLQSAAIELILRRFEDKLLTLLGYELDLSNTLDTEQSIEAACRYELFEGGLVQTKSMRQGILGSDIRGIEKLLRGEGYANSETINYLKPAKQLLRLALHRQLGDKPLKSRELFRR